MNDKYISVLKFKQSLASLTVEGGDKNCAEAVVKTLSEVVPYLLDALPAADVQPLSVVAEHIKNRLYETAINTQNEEASKTIEAMAESIDFWIDELKEGEKNE